MERRNGRDWTCTKSKKKEKNRRGKEDVRVSGVVGRDVTFSQRRIHVVNYFFVGWLIGESRNYAARTKRPLHCIGQRESGYATGKDRKNWTCSNSIFFFINSFAIFLFFLFRLVLLGLLSRAQLTLPFSSIRICTDIT